MDIESGTDASLELVARAPGAKRRLLSGRREHDPERAARCVFELLRSGLRAW